MARDYMVRGTAMDGRVRALAIHGTDLVEEIRARHDASPVVTAALGRTAMGALLLAGAALKEPEQLLTVDVRGGGPVGRIIATATGGGGVRAMAGNARVHAESVHQGKLNVAGVVGRGLLTVTKDLGMKEPYSGTVEMQSGEIGEDLAHYLVRSEQIPSAVGLGVFVVPEGVVDAAGGFLIQLLPGLSDAEAQGIEERIDGLPHPTRLIRDGLAPEEVLARIFEDDLEVLESSPVGFHCPCSRDRFEAAIVSLGAAEIVRIIDEEENDRTEVVCHFCNNRYYFSGDELRAML